MSEKNNLEGDKISELPPEGEVAEFGADDPFGFKKIGEELDINPVEIAAAEKAHAASSGVVPDSPPRPTEAAGPLDPGEESSEKSKVLDPDAIGSLTLTELLAQIDSAEIVSIDTGFSGVINTDALSRELKKAFQDGVISEEGLDRLPPWFLEKPYYAKIIDQLRANQGSVVSAEAEQAMDGGSKPDLETIPGEVTESIEMTREELGEALHDVAMTYTNIADLLGATISVLDQYVEEQPDRTLPTASGTQRPVSDILNVLRRAQAGDTEAINRILNTNVPDLAPISSAVLKFTSG